MGTLNAIYIRASDETRVPIQAKYPRAVTEAGSAFYAVELGSTDFDCPTEELANLSRQLDTDLLWITFQSVVDAFEFHHWIAGTLSRSLIFGCTEERTWERVEGAAEPWEAAAFFDPGMLSFLQRAYKNPQELETLHGIFDGRILQVGSSVPSIDARESARAVAEFYNLPGWK